MRRPIVGVAKAIVEGAQLALDKTPELPVLKQVGVVDSVVKACFSMSMKVLVILDRRP